MKTICVLLASGALCAAFAQSPARPEFEVASIKPSPEQPQNMAEVGIHVDGAQFRITFFPLREFIRVAYRLKGNQLTGPEWMDSTHFDLAAKIPEGAPRDKVLDMLQTLLVERFDIKSHRETKDLQVYALTQAKGGFKLQPLPADPNEGDRPVDIKASGGAGGVVVTYSNGAMFSLADNKFTVKKLTIAEFADAVSRFTDREVVDMTNAPGRYDFTVNMTPEDYRGLLIRSATKAGVTLPPDVLRLMEGVSGDSLFASLQTVGLKMESRKAPVEVMVVDSVSKTPKAN
jgi:uncharacterized protein (TIGR03435 family)